MKPKPMGSACSGHWYVLIVNFLMSASGFLAPRNFSIAKCKVGLQTLFQPHAPSHFRLSLETVDLFA